MIEYIDRKALKEGISADTQYIRYWDINLYELIMQGIDEAPAADVVPVVHGRWVHNENYESWAKMYVCSVCYKNALTDGDYRHQLSDFCPNCGAKMDLEEEQ